MLKNRPKRVECLTCHSQHAYRAKEPKNPSKAQSAKGSSSSTKEGKSGKKQGNTKSSQNKAEKLYTELLAEKDLSSATPYCMSDSYKIDEIINHKNFGLGIIIDLIPPKKMSVLFKDGYKYLVCGVSE